MPSLIRPRGRGITFSMLSVLTVIFDCLDFDYSLPFLLELVVALETYIVERPSDDPLYMQTAATHCLGRVMLGLDSILAVPRQLSDRCIEKVAGAMVTGKAIEAWVACTFVVERVERGTSCNGIKAALAGGFVPGLLRMGYDSYQGVDQEAFHDLFMRALTLIADCGEERYTAIVEAVGLGLIPLLESLVGRPQSQEATLKVCAKLLLG